MGAMLGDRADCGGLFAVAGHREAAHLSYLGLHALQHRGLAGVGVAVSDGHVLRNHGGSGLVQEVLTGPALQALTGHHAIGQVHATPGVGLDDRADRLAVGHVQGGRVAVALLGRLTNGARLRAELKDRHAVFQGRSDAEVLLHLIAHSQQRTFVNRLVDALWKVEGAFCVMVCTEERVVAVRDPRGFWPLLVGRLADGVLLASEDAALRFVGAEVTGELEPGQMVVIDRAGAQTVRPFAPRTRSACARELVLLARADARAFGVSVHEARVHLGEQLAREAPCREGRVVVPVPGAAEAVASGYGRVARLPVQRGLVRAPFTGRRFEEPASGVQDFGTRLRWYAVPSVIAGQEVVLVVNVVDGGADTRRLVRLLRDAGAVSVHLRVASPLVRSACFYGVGGPTPDELAVHHGDQLADWLGVDSLGCVSAVALREGLGAQLAVSGALCGACFTGDYPLPPEEPDEQLPLF